MFWTSDTRGTLTTGDALRVSLVDMIRHGGLPMPEDTLLSASTSYDARMATASVQRDYNAARARVRSTVRNIVIAKTIAITAFPVR